MQQPYIESATTLSDTHPDTKINHITPDLCVWDKHLIPDSLVQLDVLSSKWGVQDIFT